MKLLPHKLYTTFLSLMCFNLAIAQMPPAVVTISLAESKEMAPIRKVSAYSKAKYITDVKAETSGKVIQMASLGERIKAGDAMGLIADDTYALRITELTNAIKSEQSNLDFLLSEAQRLVSLSDKNLTSQSALDKNKSDLTTSKAQLAQAQSRLAQLQDSVNKLKPKAPFDAFVTEQIAQPGQYIAQGQSFLRIMSDGETEIIAYIPVKYRSVINNDAIWIYENQSGQTSEAKVTGFIPAATSSSRQIEVHLDDVSGELMPGEAITLLVPETDAKTVIAVHRDALVYRRKGASVFVIKDQVAKKVDVTTGLAQGDFIEISGLILAGDQVVVRGNERLRDQQKVQINNPN